MKPILHRYAYNAHGDLVDIRQVDAAYRKVNTFRCIGCGADMTARLGSVRSSHFAHRTGMELQSCTPETYLHKLAKLALKRKFESHGPFEVILPRHIACTRSDSCKFYLEGECSAWRNETIDLKKHYDTCSEERAVGGYVADLLLTHSSRKTRPPVLIEVAVTHRCDEAKRNSGLRIIELNVRSEDDIRSLADGAITNRMADFMGFKVKTASADLGVRRVSRFILYPSGASHVTSVGCGELDARIARNSLMEINVEGTFARYSPFDYGYVKAREMGFDVKSCIMCRYLKEGMDASLCCLYKKCGTPMFPEYNEAMQCPYYRENREYVDDVRRTMSSVPIDIVTEA